jgi:hypothetical protein
MITDKLKQHFLDHPLKDRVWVNEAGEWLHHQTAEFHIEVTREQSAGDADQSDIPGDQGDAAGDADQKQKSKSKKNDK